MEFYKSDSKLYAIEECYGAVLEFRDKEWVESRLKESDVKQYKHVSLKDAEEFTNSDPIIDIDNIFHGMSCSDE